MILPNNLRKDQNQKKQLYIDLNCDLGQSFGVYKNELESELLPYVSSVNISCGAHAGDPLTIMNALKMAKEHNLAIGAHIGYPDIQGFGNRAMQLTDEEIQSIVLYQIGALNTLAESQSLVIEFVRPHGALYKQAAIDYNVSLAIAKSIQKINPWLIYIGASGEILNKVSQEAKIRVGHEVYIDKKYKFDGSIDFDAGNVEDESYCMAQLESLIKDSAVLNNQNRRTQVKFNTIHLNSKASFSVKLAQRAKEFLDQPLPVAVNLVSDTGWV